MGGLAVRRGGGRLTPAPRRQGAADASENPIADALTRPAAARLPARRQLALRINVDRPCAGPTFDAVLLGHVRGSTDTRTRPIRWTPAPAPASPRMTSSPTTRGAGSQSGPGWQKPTEGGWTPLAPTSTASALPVSYTHLRAHETPEHLVC